MLAAGQIISGRYQLQELIGEGSMGSVWRARHTTLGKTVAVKVIHGEAAEVEGALQRFKREALLAAQLHTAHVVQVLDHGHHDDLPYIVMEYLEGETLRQRLRNRGRLSLRETGAVLKHVARALHHAHAMNLVHRDIKPENIYITPGEDGDAEVIKVLDFGVTKVPDEWMGTNAQPTQTGSLVGTPYYMSPEQAEGLKTIGPASDIWSLGVVAFECLCGRRPFMAPSMGPLLLKILLDPVPKPTEIAPDAGLPVSIDAWMAQALDRLPSGRFASAKAMVAAYAEAAGLIGFADAISGIAPPPRMPAPPRFETQLIPDKDKKAPPPATPNTDETHTAVVANAMAGTAGHGGIGAGGTAKGGVQAHAALGGVIGGGVDTTRAGAATMPQDYSAGPPPPAQPAQGMAPPTGYPTAAQAPPVAGQAPPPGPHQVAAGTMSGFTEPNPNAWTAPQPPHLAAGQMQPGMQPGSMQPGMQPGSMQPGMQQGQMGTGPAPTMMLDGSAQAIHPPRQLRSNESMVGEAWPEPPPAIPKSSNTGIFLALGGVVAALLIGGTIWFVTSDSSDGGTPSSESAAQTEASSEAETEPAASSEGQAETAAVEASAEPEDETAVASEGESKEEPEPNGGEAEPKPGPKPASKPDPKPDPKPTTKPSPKPKGKHWSHRKTL